MGSDRGIRGVLGDSRDSLGCCDLAGLVGGERFFASSPVFVFSSSSSAGDSDWDSDSDSDSELLSSDVSSLLTLCQRPCFVGSGKQTFFERKTLFPLNTP